MRQHQSDDPKVQENKLFDGYVLHSKGPPLVARNRSTNIAEIRDEHVVDQIAGYPCEPVQLAWIPGRFVRGRL